MMNILIVEDEFIIAMDLKDKIERLGYHVLGIENSAETAIDKILEFSPDLVLMDVVLKGEMDGIEATHEIWERFKIPVLYITAYSDEQTLQRIKNSPGSGILNKPLSSHDLKTSLEILFNQTKTKLCLENKSVPNPSLGK